MTGLTVGNANIQMRYECMPFKCFRRGRNHYKNMHVPISDALEDLDVVNVATTALFSLLTAGFSSPYEYGLQVAVVL